MQPLQVPLDVAVVAEPVLVLLSVAVGRDRLVPSTVEVDAFDIFVFDRMSVGTETLLAPVLSPADVVEGTANDGEAEREVAPELGVSDLSEPRASVFPGVSCRTWVDDDVTVGPTQLGFLLCCL